MNRVTFVTSSGETSNFWLEDSELVLRLEIIVQANKCWLLLKSDFSFEQLRIVNYKTCRINLNVSFKIIWNIFVFKYFA